MVVLSDSQQFNPMPVYLLTIMAAQKRLGIHDVN